MDTPTLTHHKEVIAPIALFKASFVRMKTRAKTLFTIAVIYGIAIIAFGLITKFVSEMGTPLAITITAITFIVYIVAALWATTALLDASIREDNASLGSVSKNGFKYFLPLLGVNLLVMLITIGGYLLFIIPGIAIALQLAFAAAIYIHKKTTIIEAVRSSRLVVKGRWWAICGRFLLMMLAVYAVFLVAILLSILISWLLDKNPASQITSIIIMSVVMMIYIPYMMCFIAELYHNLDKTKIDPTEVQVKKNKAFLTMFMTLGVVSIIAIIVLIAMIPSLLIKSNFKGAEDQLENQSTELDDVPASWQVDDSGAVSGENTELDALNGTPIDEPIQLNENDIEALLQDYQTQNGTAN